MKLVEILAKKLDVWPTGAAIAVQDGDAQKTVKFWSEHANPSIALMGLKDVWQAIDWKYTYQSDFDHSVLASDWKTAIVTKAQWQAERDRQKCGEWKRHRGGKQPVANEILVEFKFRSGVTGACYASDLLWDHQKQDDDVMQYRIISQPQAEEVEAKRNAAKDVDVEYAFGAPDADMSKLDWKPLGHGRISDIEFDDVTTEEVEMIKVDPVVAANVEAFNRQWQIGRVDSPLVWRDTVTELNAYIEEFTRERDELINRLASEGFALIPAMTPVVGVADVDMSDWRNWKEGDIVKCINTNYPSFISVGTMYKITGFDGESILFRDDQGDDMDDICVNFEFHSRP